MSHARTNRFWMLLSLALLAVWLAGSILAAAGRPAPDAGATQLSQAQVHTANG